ncbi:Laccase-1 [Eufriesea mexicana]|uniref:Laccase-1 n=1 Tax=Eufriesea mexicana TaxID=516756 RepID=A0A310SAH3_9HYME|nr:Laccase-1 [Eufriesea mexicana]
MIYDKTISSKRFLGINGKSPGPKIEVCLGDTIEVLLYNRLGSDELSFHWHGLPQKNSAHMDGVSMITQCSILPFGGFRYKLKPENVGTYIYYAHVVSQQGDGVYGSLTVRGPQDDPSLERILLLSSRPPTPLSQYSHLHPPTPSELLLNGQNNGSTLNVHHGAKYLLRLINANAYNCPVLLSISGHDFQVSATDGNPVEPATGRHIVSFPETNDTRLGMEWTRDKTLELLREYQQRRVLWDWNARGYRDRAKRKRAIQELAEILCCNTLEIEKKITNLKCQYSREVHKIQNSRDAATGPDDVYVSKWFAFKAMQFLQFGTRRYSKRKKKAEEETSKLQEEYIVSDIDPESITFIDCNEETNGSGTGSFNASLSEDAEESSSSSLKAMELYNGSLLSHNSPICDLDESGQTKLETTSDERKRTKEEFAKFAESIAVQLAEIPDSYSRSVAKLRINQILFEAEIGVYAQTRERFDLIIEANQPPGKYLIDIRGFLNCQNLHQEAFILYDDTKPESTIIKDEELLKINDYAIANKGHDCHKISRNLICALDLKGSKRAEIYSNEVIYIPFDVNTYSHFTDEMSDYRYNVYGCPFYPSDLSTNKEGVKVAQINRMSFKYPTSPLLSQPENTPTESICSLERRSRACTDTPLFCECIQVIEVSPGKNVDIILLDEGFGGNISQTFHIHGYNASILGRNSFEHAITKDDIMLLDHNKQLHRNVLNPPQKDSFIVPNKGYVILRLFTDNLGYWLWEARSTAISPGISGPVMQFLLKVGNDKNFLSVPLNFPTCGNNKHPDMIFEQN